jgi:hypothetical protein
VGPLAANVGVQFRQTASLYWQGWLIAVAMMLVPFFSFLYDVAMRHYYPDTIDPEEESPLEGPISPTPPVTTPRGAAFALGARPRRRRRIGPSALVALPVREV